MKKSKQIAFCALMIALSVVFLLLGGITSILDLTAVVISAMVLFVVYEELKFAAVLVYLGVTLIAFILPNGLTMAVEYAIFAIYPILKPIFEKAPKVVSIIIKLIFMIASVTTLTLLLNFVLSTPEVWYINLAFGVGAVVFYYLFDLVLTKFGKYYRETLRSKLRLDKFFK